MDKRDIEKVEIVDRLFICKNSLQSVDVSAGLHSQVPHSLLTWEGMSE